MLLLGCVLFQYWLVVNAIQSLHQPLQPIHELKTVVDFRGGIAYKYRGKNNLIATRQMNHSMEMQFDLRVHFEYQNTSVLQWIPILFFQGESVQMTIYVNECGQFGIMHYDPDLDRIQHHERLILVDLFRIPESLDTNKYQNFNIKIVNKERVRLRINDCVINQYIEREICRSGESLNVWLDRAGFRVKASIRNLLIRAR